LSEKARVSRFIFPLSQTFVLRLMSVVTQSVLPVYLVNFLGYTVKNVGIPITLIWIGNAVGAFLAFYVIRRGRLNGVIGFVLIAASYFGLAEGKAFAGLVPLFVFLGGAGSGSVQPLLAPTVHLFSPNGRKYMGIGSYSVALSIGLVVGPFVASFAVNQAGYALLFESLGLLSFAYLAISIIFVRSKQLEVNSISGETVSYYRKLFLQSGFTREFILNFLYSLTLPVILSYATVTGEAEYGIGASSMLRLMTVMFVVSLAIRAAISTSKSTRFDQSMILPGVVLPFSLAAMAFHTSALVFSLGLIGFGIPHALIYPWALYNSLQSVDSGAAPAVSYLFSISSGAAETASPPLASYVVGIFGGSSAFFAALPFGVIAALWVVAKYHHKVET